MTSFCTHAQGAPCAATITVQAKQTLTSVHGQRWELFLYSKKKTHRQGEEAKVFFKDLTKTKNTHGNAFKLRQCICKGRGQCRVNLAVRSEAVVAGVVFVAVVGACLSAAATCTGTIVFKASSETNVLFRYLQTSVRGRFK